MFDLALHNPVSVARGLKYVQITKEIQVRVNDDGWSRLRDSMDGRDMVQRRWLSRSGLKILVFLL